LYRHHWMQTRTMRISHHLSAVPPSHNNVPSGGVWARLSGNPCQAGHCGSVPRVWGCTGCMLGWIPGRSTIPINPIPLRCQRLHECTPLTAPGRNRAAGLPAGAVTSRFRIFRSGSHHCCVPARALQHIPLGYSVPTGAVRESSCLHFRHYPPAHRSGPARPCVR